MLCIVLEPCSNVIHCCPVPFCVLCIAVHVCWFGVDMVCNGVETIFVNGALDGLSLREAHNIAKVVKQNKVDNYGKYLGIRLGPGAHDC